MLNGHLGQQKYLTGDQLSLADITLFADLYFGFAQVSGMNFLGVVCCHIPLKSRVLAKLLAPEISKPFVLVELSYDFSYTVLHRF